MLVVVVRVAMAEPLALVAVVQREVEASSPLDFLVTVEPEEAEAVRH